MTPNTSTQSKDLFKDCLGFARQLSKSPEIYCRLEVKLGENSFILQTGSPGKFPGQGKALAITEETREERNLLKRGCLLRTKK